LKIGIGVLAANELCIDIFARQPATHLIDSNQQLSCHNNPNSILFIKDLKYLHIFALKTNFDLQQIDSACQLFFRSCSIGGGV